MGKSSTCFCPTGGGDGNIADCFSSVSLHCRVNPVSVVGHPRIDCIPALLDNWNRHIWDCQYSGGQPQTRHNHPAKPSWPLLQGYACLPSLLSTVLRCRPGLPPISFGLKFQICGEYIPWPLTWQVFFLVMPPENKVVRLQHCWLWWQCWYSSVVLLFLRCTCTEHSRKNGSRCWWVGEG